MQKILLTFQLKLRCTCRHAVWRSVNLNEMRSVHPAYHLFWHLPCCSQSGPLINLNVYRPASFHPPVNNNAIVEGGLLFPINAKCPAEVSMCSQHGSEAPECFGRTAGSKAGMAEFESKHGYLRLGTFLRLMVRVVSSAAKRHHLLDIRVHGNGMDKEFIKKWLKLA